MAFMTNQEAILLYLLAIFLKDINIHYLKEEYHSLAQLKYIYNIDKT